MRTIIKILFLLIIFTFLPLLAGCGPSQHLQAKSSLYRVSAEQFQDNRFSPAFVIYNPQETYNRIGTPVVRQLADDRTDILVDAEKPTIYFEQDQFSTAKETYHNLIYRIHFEKVPLGIGQFNLTAGNNPGILIIFTFDRQGNLLLITTVHTCGCFLAFFPTDKMGEELYRAEHPAPTQWIYGHTLPSKLLFSPYQPPLDIVFSLESETHRIINIAISDRERPDDYGEATLMTTAPMVDLYHLPSSSGTESFFEMSGPREGYVKNNTKILERLLMSWWAFDWHVGEDKAYGKNDKSSTPLYTSLKFWARQDSDLKNFPRFLAYWGWNF